MLKNLAILFLLACAVLSIEHVPSQTKFYNELSDTWSYRSEFYTPFPVQLNWRVLGNFQLDFTDNKFVINGTTYNRSRILGSVSMDITFYAAPVDTFMRRMYKHIRRDGRWFKLVCEMEKTAENEMKDHKYFITTYDGKEVQD